MKMLMVVKKFVSYGAPDAYDGQGPNKFDWDFFVGMSRRDELNAEQVHRCAERLRKYRNTQMPKNLTKYYSVRLHGNEILRIYSDKFIPMDAGWRTVTTKARLNEHMEVGHIHQRDFTWYYTIGDTEYLWSDVYFVSMHLLPHQYPPKTQVMSQSEYRAWKETWEMEE